MAAAHIHVYTDQRKHIRTFGGNRSTVREVARHYLSMPGYAIDLCRGVNLPETKSMRATYGLLYSDVYMRWMRVMRKEKQNAQR